MSKLRLNFVLVYCVFAFCIMILSSCKKDSTSSIPFQGPKNGSFETTDSWFVTYSAWSGTYNGVSSASLVSGTGFLPSNGIWYARLASYNVFSAPDATIYQDNVDLSHSGTITFDYTFSGTLGAGGGTATAYILFTSNGTQTLWTKIMDNTNPPPVQKLNETISLPATSSTGRLTIKLSITGGQQGSTGTQTNVVFGIDNIRVK